jgi:aryl-alcohol dehydrogenase-like predicted oxidoreductase
VEYRYLGATGLKVSELGLGAMTFGRETSEDDSHRMLDRFVDAGGNFIDTANVYGAGTSEEILGRWLAGRPRDEYVIATKVRARSLEQLDANLGAVGWALTHDQVECLNRASDPGLPYPYDHLAGAQARR